jgi:hypothetical protein
VLAHVGQVVPVEAASQHAQALPHVDGVGQRDDREAAGAQDAAELAECEPRILDVLDALAARDRIEGSGGEGKRAVQVRVRGLRDVAPPATGSDRCPGARPASRTPRRAPRGNRRRTGCRPGTRLAARPPSTCAERIRGSARYPVSGPRGRLPAPLAFRLSSKLLVAVAPSGRTPATPSPRRCRALLRPSALAPKNA